MEITKTTVLEVSQSSQLSSSADTSTAADDGEFQEQYDTVMKEVIVLDNSLVNKGQVTVEDLVGRPEDKTKVDNSRVYFHSEHSLILAGNLAEANALN